jgi:hypothetical protein
MGCRMPPYELAFMAKIGYMRILHELLAAMSFAMNTEPHRNSGIYRLLDAYIFAGILDE